MTFLFIQFLPTGSMEEPYFITVAIEKHNIEAISDGRWMSSLGSLWFLWSVLCASIVIAVCEKITSIKILRLLIIILGAGFVWLFPNNDMNLFMYPFFVGGFYFAKYKDKIPMALMNVKYFSLVLFPLMMLFYQKKHFFYTTGIKSSANKLELLSIDLFRWAIGFIGSVFVLVILEVIYNNLICKKLIIAKPVAQLGKKSLQVYCLSIPLLSFWLPKVYSKFCNKIGGNFFAANMYLYNFIFTFFLAVLYAIAIYYFAILLEKVKVGKLIFGR